jgi:hypothetical protein
MFKRGGRMNFESTRTVFAILALWFVLLVLSIFIIAVEAKAHEAPSGMTYPVQLRQLPGEPFLKIDTILPP